MEETLWFQVAARMHSWPIPIERFPFRQRTRCERFVFVGGKGGCLAAHENGRDYLNRKGLQLVLDTARLVPKRAFLDLYIAVASPRT